MTKIHLNATRVAIRAKTTRDYLSVGVLIFEAVYKAAAKISEMSKGVTP